MVRSALVIAGGLLFAAAAQAQALVQGLQSLDAMMRNYNVISFGNVSLGDESEGPLAVKGNFTMTQERQVAFHTSKFGPSSDPTLYVGGQISGTIKLESGYASTPNVTGTLNVSGSQRMFTKEGGGGVINSSNSSDTHYSYQSPKTNPGPAGWNWTNIESEAIAISNLLATATAANAAMGSITTSGGKLIFSAPNDNAGGQGVVVFNLDANLLSGTTYNGVMNAATNIQANIAEGNIFVINVHNLGDTADRRLFDSGVNLNAGGITGADRLLWNILPSASGNAVTLGGGDFHGSVLAPLVDINNGDAGIIDGQVIARNFTQGSREMHFTGFDASGIAFSAVPEPSTYALMGAAVCVGGAVWQRRRRRKAA